jgi:putative ABC transport system permease protein
LSLPEKKYKDDASLGAFYRELLSKIDHLPGVRSASMENLPPFSGFAFWGVQTDVVLPGQASMPVAKLPLTAVRVVGPGYLRTMAIPLVQGREFSPAELAEERHVVMVNETFVRKYFPQTNPIGQRITIDMKDVNIPSEIIGVAGDVHGADLTADPWPTTYWPYPELAYTQMTVIVRTDTDPLALVSSVHQIVQEMDKDQPISNVSTMDQLISNSAARSRLTTWLLAVFAALALILACIGVYGVMAYATAQRRNEIGIRMALGAQPRDVLRLVLGQGVKLALLGVVIGVAGGLAVTRYLQTLLFNVKASDPLTFAGVAILLAIVALAACYIPARRAMRIDPISALKYE